MLAVQKVGSLPELVHLICEAQCNKQGWTNIAKAAREAATFMLVNKLWNKIAAKYIWRLCGQKHGPCVLHLVKMSLNPTRPQHYANFIKEMILDSSFDSTLGKMVPQEFDSLLDLFQKLDFPLLQSVRVSGRYVKGGDMDPFMLATPLLRNSVKTLVLDLMTLSPRTFIALKVSIHCCSAWLLRR